jgi:hypothetical protein
VIDGIEPLYQQIAESIQEAIPEPWAVAWIDAIFYSEHVFYSGEFAPTSENKPKSFATGRIGRKAFVAIREKFREAGRPLWCRARFEVFSDGRFKMNLGYVDCDEAGNAKFDEDAERRRLREQLGPS